MPKIVSELPKTNRGRARKYDFIDELFPQLEGTEKAAELIPGEDFECSTGSMRQYLYRTASERGLKAMVRTYEDDKGRDVVVFAVEKAKPKPKDSKATNQGEAKVPAGASA